ncbi:hypothetical protein ACLMJK_007016 [Lecanora helva]
MGDSCELSPKAHAFSTVLTAFVGSIVNGITSGALVAFMTGWISWLAVFRIIAGSLIALHHSFTSDYMLIPGGSSSIPAEEIELSQRREVTSSEGSVPGQGIALQGRPSLSDSLGCFSLCAIVDHRHKEALINTGSVLGMGAICAALLIKGAIKMHVAASVIAPYCIFAVIWAVASFRIVPVRDAGIKEWGIILDVLVGAFAGLFVAFIAFGLMTFTDDPESVSKSLNDYLASEDMEVWQKFVAIFPG